MSFALTCPNCGRRESREFWFGGEYRPFPDAPAAEGLEANFQRVWLRVNARGTQIERWFHFAGCRRWMFVERDTEGNVVAPTVTAPTRENAAATEAYRLST